MGKTPDHWDVEEDMVIVGSGFGALAGALVAREHGVGVTVFECSDKIGGGSAYSGGMVWIGNNHHMAEEGIADSREDTLTYLRSISGGAHDESMLQTYVDVAPEVIKYLEDKAGLKMLPVNPNPDYYADLPGGKMGGRYLVPELFDSKTLGEWQPKLRFTPHFPLAMTFAEIAKWGGYAHIGNWDWDLLGRRVEDGIAGWGTALVGFMLKACVARNVKFVMKTRVRQLLQDATGRVVGVRAEQDGRSIFVKASRGTLLASGGFEWNREMRQRLGTPEILAVSPPFNRGDGQIMALELGAAWVRLDDPGLPAVAIPGEEHDGQPLYRLVNRDPSRPGMIIVNRQGKRFADEAFWRAITRSTEVFDGATQTRPNAPYFGIWDQNYKDKYSVSSVLPWDPSQAWMNGSASLSELAAKLGIDAAGLEETVANFNKCAREGRDPDFHRGESAYDRHNGDDEHTPNPSLGPIEKPPFYGCQLVHAAVDTGSGLLTNKDAQVIHLNGESIAGLYAAPNVAARTAVGLGYTSGQILAMAMTFSYQAVTHANWELGHV